MNIQHFQRCTESRHLFIVLPLLALFFRLCPGRPIPRRCICLFKAALGKHVGVSKHWKESNWVQTAVLFPIYFFCLCCISKLNCGS